jgi:putative membrane protein
MIGAAIGSAVHILSVVLGFLFMWVRAHRLAQPLDGKGLDRMLWADNWAGIVSLSLVGSGLTRLFYLEKSPEFYYRNGFFWLKMSIYGTVFLLEMVPMTAFIKWRIDQKKGKPLDTSRAPLYRRITHIELGLLVTIPFCAAMMARGLWLF